MKLSTQVIEIDPDWLLVTFSGTKPPGAKRAFWLHRTLSDWLAAHPGRSVVRTLAIQTNGELVGVHVWLDSRSRSERSLPVMIHNAVSTTVHKEHLEALMQQAYGIFFERPKVQVLAVVSRGGIAAVFDRTAEQAYLLPAKDLQTDEQARAKIQQWLAAPDDKCLIIELASFQRE